jgi:hypothetical protein
VLNSVLPLPLRLGLLLLRKRRARDRRRDRGRDRASSQKTKAWPPGKTPVEQFGRPFASAFHKGTEDHTLILSGQLALDGTLTRLSVSE